MGIKDFLDRIKQKNEMVKQLETQDRAENRVQEKKLSANERTLNKILKEKREELITKELEKYGKQKQDEYWHKDMISQKYIFKETSNLMHQPSLLKQKKMFGGRK